MFWYTLTYMDGEWKVCLFVLWMYVWCIMTDWRALRDLWIYTQHSYLLTNKSSIVYLVITEYGHLNNKKRLLSLISFYQNKKKNKNCKSSSLHSRISFFRILIQCTHTYVHLLMHTAQFGAKTNLKGSKWKISSWLRRWASYGYTIEEGRGHCKC